MPENNKLYCITITYGHTDIAGCQISPEALDLAERHLLFVFAETFDGAQVAEQRGSYKQRDGNVVLETSTSVWAFCRDARPYRKRLENAARRVGSLLRQDCVLLSIEAVTGEIIFVTASEPDTARTE